MNIRESLIDMQIGDRLIVEGERSQVNYIRVLAKENGWKLRQKRRSTGEWVLYCIGEYEQATIVWLRRLRAKKEWFYKNRKKVASPKSFSC